jgi:hypothetical protein
MEVRRQLSHDGSCPKRAPRPGLSHRQAIVVCQIGVRSRLAVFLKIAWCARDDRAAGSERRAIRLESGPSSTRTATSKPSSIRSTPRSMGSRFAIVYLSHPLLLIARDFHAQKGKAYWFFLFHLVPELPAALIAGRRPSAPTLLFGLVLRSSRDLWLSTLTCGPTKRLVPCAVRWPTIAPMQKTSSRTLPTPE